MSQRDKALLDTAGLSVTAAAGVFERSRQALYQGLSQPRDYFSARDAIVLLHECKSKDSDKTEDLMRFIEENYTRDNVSASVFPDPAFAQLEHVISNADKITLVCNGNMDLLSSPDAGLTRIIQLILRGDRARDTNMIVAGTWIAEYIVQTLEIDLSGIKIESQADVMFLPSFLLTHHRKQNRAEHVRAFVFGRLAIEELYGYEASRLASKFPAC